MTTQKAYKRRPQKSLRSLLMVLFFVFSIVPLTFLAFYSIYNFRKALDNELTQRLVGNSREMSVIVDDFKDVLIQRRNLYRNDPTLLYGLATGSPSYVKEVGSRFLAGDIATTMTYFDRDGHLILSLYKDEQSSVRSYTPGSETGIALSKESLDFLKQNKESFFITFSKQKKVSLVLISSMVSRGGRLAGYVEQAIDLNASFINKIKERLNLELLILDGKGAPVLATHSDFYLYSPETYTGFLDSKDRKLFDINIRGAAYGFSIFPMTWGEQKYHVAFGTSKAEIRSVLDNLNYAFGSVVGTLIVFLAITIFVVSKAVLKPLYDLLNAIHAFQDSDSAVAIPIKSDTEIGLLTESFNEMSRKVVDARNDLRKKISELEKANQEIKEAQSQLIQTAKMASLGQLVAGVAHELNNPIGYIYSNMSHLKEHSDNLLSLIDLAEADPSNLNEKKKEFDLDYIREDLPKLIASCEEGAKRTKDIVLSLRNFSRLQEASLKEVDLATSISTTLSLLSNEIKNRIEVHKDMEPTPPIWGHGGQINQVFMNLLSNAIQAISGPGDIWITVRNIRDQNNSIKKISISIQDSGCGIPENLIEKIFDPFFTTKDVGQGTGLGLSITYGIIQRHGGELQVRSQEGKGTEFIIILPLRPPAEVRSDMTN